MANIRSFQIENRVPVPSHGAGSTGKAMRFQVELPDTLAGDTIDFGFLPQNAYPFSLSIVTTGSVTGSFKIGADVLFAGTLTPNVVQRASGMSLLVRPEKQKLTALVTAPGAAGTLNLILKYAIHEFGVAYPNEHPSNDFPSDALTSPIDGRILLSPIDGRILLRPA